MFAFMDTEKAFTILGIAIAAIIFIYLILAIIINRAKDEKFEKIMRRIRMGFTLVMFAAIAFMFIYNYAGGFYDDTPEKQQAAAKTQKLAQKELSARIFIKDNMLKVTNLNKFAWTPIDTFSGYGIKFVINDDFKFFYARRVNKNESIQIPVGQFTKKDGFRFNLLIFKPERVQISCKEDVKTFFFQ